MVGLFFILTFSILNSICIIRDIRRYKNIYRNIPYKYKGFLVISIEINIIILFTLVERVFLRR